MAKRDKTMNKAMIFAAFAAIILALVLTGCKNDTQNYVQPENTTAVIDNSTGSNATANSSINKIIYNTTMVDAKNSITVCIIDNSTYYVWDYFIYVAAPRNGSIIMAWPGTYIYDKQRALWNFFPFKNKEDNIYFDSIEWIKAGSTPLGEKIYCAKTEKVPKMFLDFYISHKPLYDKAAKNRNATNSTAKNTTADTF
jgi:hypothetical protein